MGQIDIKRNSTYASSLSTSDRHAAKKLAKPYVSAQARQLQKAVLLNKIATERMIVALQVRRLGRDASVDGIKHSLTETFSYYFANNSTTSKFLSTILKHPKLSLLFSRFLLRTLSKRKQGFLRSALFALASCFIYKKFK